MEKNQINVIFVQNHFGGNWKDTFKSHMLIHTREKSYTCNICPILFSRKVGLKSQVIIHTGDKGQM